MGVGDVRLCRTGMHPPFFFVLPKKNPPEGLLLLLCSNSPSAPCTVEEKGAKAQNGASRLICLKYGVPTRDLSGRGRMQRWARSSQSPYLSLAAYAKSSLIPMLVLSPRKPLRWVFVGAPKLSAFSHANWSCGVGQRLEGPAANVAAAGLERPGSGSGACC